MDLKKTHSEMNNTIKCHSRIASRPLQDVWKDFNIYHSVTQRHLELARFANSKTTVTSFLQQNLIVKTNFINAGALFTKLLIKYD